MKLNLFVKNTGKLILIGALILTACKKKDDTKEETPTEEAQPSASFTASKSDYIVGDTIVLTSSSTNAGSLRWTLPNGTTETTHSIRFATTGYTATPVDLEIPFRLDAMSPSGKKTDYTIKNVKIGRQIKGGLLIWMPRPNNVTLTGTLIMDGKSLGAINVYCGTMFPTDCDQAGYTTLHLPVGSHVFTFNYTENGNNATSTKSATITENDCTFINFN